MRLCYKYLEKITKHAIAYHNCHLGDSSYPRYARWNTILIVELIQFP